MKKAFPLLVLLLALAAIVVFTRRRTGGGGNVFPMSRAAELAPFTTVTYLEIPDLARTASRWRKSELYAITQEPEWQATHWQFYLETWLKQAKAAQGNQVFFTLLAELEKVEPAGFFLAANDLGGRELPEIVGGLSYRGKRSDVEAAVRVLKEALLRAWPGAKSELVQHEGMEVESIASVTRNEHTPWSIVLPDTDNGSLKALPAWTSLPNVRPALHLSFRDNWLFFSSRRHLLTDLLDRYVSKAGAAKSLVQDPGFAESRTHGLGDADLLAWARWNQAGRELVAEWLPRTVPEMGPNAHVCSVQYTGRLDGPVRDRFYFQLFAAPQAQALVNRPLALCPPDAPGCLTINLEALRGQPEWIVEQMQFSHPLTMPALLRGRELTTDDLWAAFGPEMGIYYFGPGRAKIAHFMAALEVRDPVKARKFALLFVDSGPRTTVSERDGTTVWEWKPDATEPKTMAIVLTKTHLLFGNSDKTQRVAEAIGRAEKQTNPASAAALPGATMPNGALLLVDTEKLYRGLKVQAPRAARMYEPEWKTAEPWEAIQRHLRPGSISLHTEGQGWVIESTLNVFGVNLVNQLLER